MLCWYTPHSGSVSLFHIVTLHGHPSTVHGEDRTQGRNTVRHPRVRRWHATWPRHRRREVLEIFLHSAGLQSARWEVGGVGFRRHPLEVDAHLQSREQEVEGIDHASAVDLASVAEYHCRERSRIVDEVYDASAPEALDV